MDRITAKKEDVCGNLACLLCAGQEKCQPRAFSFPGLFFLSQLSHNIDNTTRTTLLYFTTRVAHYFVSLKQTN